MFHLDLKDATVISLNGNCHGNRQMMHEAIILMQILFCKYLRLCNHFNIYFCSFPHTLQPIIKISSLCFKIALVIDINGF